jgi:phosphohistidine phosphatase
MEVILIRHAKSSWQDVSLLDYDRPLNGRGRRDGSIMAQWLPSKLDTEQSPRLIASSSKRTRQTAQYFISTLKIDDSTFTKKLYHASIHELQEVIQEQATDSLNLIIAHNPGLTEALNQVPGLRLDNLPTCGVASLNYNGTPNTFTFEQCQLNWINYPKAL